MDNVTIVLLLVAGFYVGLLAAQSGLTFKKAVKPFTGLLHMIGNMLDRPTNNKEEEDAKKEETNKKRRRTRKPL